MKVLMFGWEFPPHILGGLGTASYGLTKGLSCSPIWISLFVFRNLGEMKTKALEDYRYEQRAYRLA